ncbi:hypothetical protein MKEN_01414100 [Mycena kentingensis (nom. inval.)]|nr:hypothetical protein MKEN_01414100 [Mycena kentingensis (nom. inval.)]
MLSPEHNLTADISQESAPEPSSRNKNPALRRPPARFEADFYYFGLAPQSQHPRLIYRTGKPMKPSPDPDNIYYRRRKQVCGVFGHALNTVWDSVGPQIRDVLTSQSIPWTTIDGVRFLTEGQYIGYDTLGPVVIWIGIRPPGSLEWAEAALVTEKILRILEDVNVDDVDVEFRESSYRALSGPGVATLLPPESGITSAFHVREPLTTALGVPIAASDGERAGTLGLYIADGDQLLGLTSGHVVGASTDDSDTAAIEILGADGFGRLLSTTQKTIQTNSDQAASYRYQVGRLQRELADSDATAAEKERRVRSDRYQVESAEEVIAELGELLTALKQDWSEPSQRIIGSIAHAAPLAFRDDYIEDWAILKLDKAKFGELCGNKMSLANAYAVSDPGAFRRKLDTVQYRTTRFRWSSCDVLHLTGILSEDLIRFPDMRDTSNNPANIFLKNGGGTGLTLGRSTGIESYVRDPVSGRISRAWPVFNYETDVFAGPGDSGAVVADYLGRICGIIQGGCVARDKETVHTTYVTPMCWLWSKIKEHFPNARLYDIEPV